MSTGRAGVPRVIVMAKSPVPGRVKTRLCPPCTPEQAARLAEAALADTLAMVAATPAGGRVVALDGDPGPWLPADFEVVSQRGDGFDHRLAAALDDVGAPAVVIAGDTPQLTSSLLDRALTTLGLPGVDAVLGPTDDGGYWAIGLRRARPEVFVGVPMGTSGTCSAQRLRLRQLGLRVTELPALRDVDRIDDALAVAATIPGSRFAIEVAAVAAGLTGDERPGPSGVKTVPG